jgi:hypothetical protein
VFLTNEYFNQWKNGFGNENFRLIIAVDKETKETIGSVSTAYYKSIENSEPLMTLGMFFVRPDKQKLGLGTELFKLALNDSKFKDINWGLNGVEKMTKGYATRYGYDKYLPWHVCNYDILGEKLNPSNLESDSSVSTVSMNNINSMDLIKYDASILNSVRRDGYILNLLNEKNSFSKIAVDYSGKVVGFGNICFNEENKLYIGPLYSNTNSIAETVLKSILETIPNLNSYKNLIISPPNLNEEAKKIFDKLSDGNVKSNAIIYGQFTKHAIKADPTKIFSITDNAMSFC